MFKFQKSLSLLSVENLSERQHQTLVDNKQDRANFLWSPEEINMFLGLLDIKSPPFSILKEGDPKHNLDYTNNKRRIGDHKFSMG